MEYKIKIREGTTPFALTIPRHMAIPLLESMKSEARCYLPCTRASRLVCGNIGGASVKQQSVALHRSHET